MCARFMRKANAKTGQERRTERDQSRSDENMKMKGREKEGKK